VRDSQALTVPLEELSVSALEYRTDEDIPLGAGGEVIAELQAIVTEQPLRERTASALNVIGTPPKAFVSRSLGGSNVGSNGASTGSRNSKA
jgi:hypothetical protein